MYDRIEAMIRDSVRRLTERPEFVAWRKEEAPAPGDILLINNSFVFRDVRTNKADEYLCFLVEDPPESAGLGIAVGISINLDFKRVAAASSNPPLLTPLKSALEPGINQLGHLVFLLVGEVQDTEVLQTDLHHEAFQAVVWDPASADEAHVEANKLVVKQTADEALVWTDVAGLAGVDPQPALRTALGVALDKLQDQAVAKVVIPAPGEAAPFGITDAILAVLKEQRDQYADIVGSAGATASALNDVLRIAYNFASDATGFLRLIVSVCDLKPIVL